MKKLYEKTENGVIFIKELGQHTNHWKITWNIYLLGMIIYEK